VSHQTGILAALRDWGLTVVEVPGWQTRGSSDFDPKGHVVHHDVVPDQPGDNDRVPSIIINGRSDLPGPLANFWLEKDGNVHLCAAGRANHAGEGGWNGLSGNSTVWGTEMNNLGTPADPWPDRQLEAMYRLAAATCDFSGSPVRNVCGHKEWAPTRKIDPHTINMNAFRSLVALQEKEGLTVGQFETLEDRIIAQGQKTRALIRDLYRAEAERDRKLSAKEIDAISAAHD
jgi:hypothetical protein